MVISFLIALKHSTTGEEKKETRKINMYAGKLFGFMTNNFNKFNN